jgi:hypothetical protein
VSFDGEEEAYCVKRGANSIEHDVLVFEQALVEVPFHRCNLFENGIDDRLGRGGRRLSAQEESAVRSFDGIGQCVGRAFNSEDEVEMSMAEAMALATRITHCHKAVRQRRHGDMRAT